MNKMTKMALKTLIISIILVMLLSGTALANGSADGIEVSPNVINLDSNGGSFSIHTNIPFSSVTVELLTADGTPITKIVPFSDDRGDLVVKFDPRDDEGNYLFGVGDVTFELTVSASSSAVTTIYDDTVRVISCGK